MGTQEAIRRVLRDSEVPLDAALIAELVGADSETVAAVLNRMERDGIARHQEEWSLA